MKINEMIKEKRINKKMTQEQVAQYLGVSTPAVNKWEKGISYPDITLLPPLARLLDTDLNTLLSFKEDLSEYEIGMFLNELSSFSDANDFSHVYSMAIQKINEFPNCYALIYHIATVLDGICDMKKENEYKDKIKELYKRVAQSNDEMIGNQAKVRLINNYLKQKEYLEAELLLKEIPEKNSFDKKRIEAKILIETNKLDEAVLIEEQRLLSTVNELQSILLSIMNIAIKQERFEDATYIANVFKESMETLDWWDYTTHLAHFELYTKTKQRVNTIKTILVMFKTLNKQWKLNESPLYHHIKTKVVDVEEQSKFKEVFLDAVLNDEETAFVKDARELKELK